MKRIAIVIGSMLWGILVFRIALGIHFPTQEVKNRIEVEVDQSTKSEIQLKLGDLGLNGLIGVKASNAIVYQKDGEDSVPTFVLDSLSVGLSPIQTLLGALGVSIDGEMLGGTLSAYFSADSLSTNLESLNANLDLSSINLSMLPIMNESFEANLQGALTGHLEGNFPQELPHKNSKGRLSLAINGLSISDANVQGFALPSLTFSQASLEGLFDKGKLEITDANFVSESIGLDISGDILLAKQWQRSRLRLTLELTLGSEFALISKMVPQLKNNKVGEEDGDSIYKLNIIGTIKNPRIKTGNRKTNRRPSRTTNRDEGEDIKSSGPASNDRRSQTPEERRKARRERIEARKRAQEARKEAGALDLPDNPMRAMPSRPLQRVPILDADEDEDIIEEEDDVIEDDIDEQEPSDDIDEQEPSDDGEDDDNMDED